ncbi:MAG: hypothetical protein KF760_29720 [Candidatus Eremiobacteraeota bacterium]|nr:hypothetical protein [Candidatus Eremiobacteraeota bacterium]MCW5870581.1 hypothetical protein [Candidatus Eremiobacteraeota bacterium]
MVSIVASLDHESGCSQIHLVLDHALMPDDQRLERVCSLVQSLEERFEPDRVEVICAYAHTLEEFRATDPRFLDAPYPAESPVTPPL